MKKINSILSILIITIAFFSSCSKPEYTASFAPSKPIRYTEVEKPVFTKTETVKSEDAITTSKTPIKVPVAKTELVKPTNLIKENGTAESTFNKSELKQMKRDSRKAVFKAVKNSILKKKPTNQDKLIPIILSLFPILCLIGIYLYQGENITNDFWLDLVLHLTVIGEIIYALLVVLDVVSIA